MNEQVEFASYGVLKVAGTDPEVFWILFTNPKAPKPRGLFMRTSDNLGETELRTELGRMGLGEARIDELIEKARANPR
ncbi:MAG: hypothetical protein WA765_05130 [Candidatus Acidiferrum sp.]